MKPAHCFPVLFCLTQGNAHGIDALKQLISLPSDQQQQQQQQQDDNAAALQHILAINGLNGLAGSPNRCESSSSVNSGFLYSTIYTFLSVPSSYQ